MIKYSVCIATYKRQKLLKKLIDSLLNQKNIDLSAVELIIVDNDAEGSARNVVEEYMGKVICSISYEIQPKKNIAITRNVAVKKALGIYIFFIDDDEYADENWMAALVNILLELKADASFGQVRSYFPEGIPDWIKKSHVYNRKMNATGDRPNVLGTGNCIIKSEFFHSKNYHFNHEYGLTGGEDNHLFSKIEIDGAKFVSCNEAITFEYVPHDRANLKWLVKRVFRTGNTYARVQIFQNGKRSIVLSIREFLKGIIQAVIAFLISILFVWNKQKSIFWFLKSISNFSKMLAVLGIYPKEYK